MQASIILILTVPVLLSHTACHLPYRPIPESVLKTCSVHDTLDNAIISWKYHVQKEAGNNYHARAEKQRKVSLLAVYVQNIGTDTMCFPDDVLIVSGDQPLTPLPQEEAFEALRATYADKRNSGIVDVEGGVARMLRFSIVAQKAVMQALNNLELAEDMNRYYIVPSRIPPGKSYHGVLALAVVPGTPVRFTSW